MKQKLLKLARPSTLIVILAMGVVGALYFLFGCPIKYVTGLSCPGCGMTRALWSAATLRFGQAWHYHPLFWLVPPALFLIASRWARSRPKLRTAGLSVVVAAFLAVYLLRLFAFPNEVVGWTTPGLMRDFSDGFARLRWWM